MKLQNRLPHFDENLDSELLNKGWVPLKEPYSLVISLLLAVPFMLVNVLISIASINIFSSITFAEFGFSMDSFSISVNLGTILIIALLIIFHELLHLLFIPNFMQSEKTYIGFIWLGGFVITEEEIVKPRYLIITIAPFVVISIAAPIILGALGLLTSTLKVIVLLNALASSVDMLTFSMIVKQVPGKAILRQNGPKNYWKN